jgi:hypothetical protein
MTAPYRFLAPVRVNCGAPRQRPRGMPILFLTPKSSLIPLLIELGSLSRSVLSGVKIFSRPHMKSVVASEHRQSVWRYCQWLLDFDISEPDGAYTHPPRVIHSEFRPWPRGRHHFVPLRSVWSRRTSGPTRSAPIQKPNTFVRSFVRMLVMHTSSCDDPMIQLPIAGTLIVSHLMCGCYISAWGQVVIFLE